MENEVSLNLENIPVKLSLWNNVMFDPKLEISKADEFIIHMPYV